MCTPEMGFLDPTGVRGTFLVAEVHSSMEKPSCDPRMGAQSSLAPGPGLGALEHPLSFRGVKSPLLLF